MYNIYKSFENAVLYAASEIPNFKTYVICPGIPYGCGEESLFDLFKTAWKGIPGELPIYGHGDNYIPMIHIKDLAKHVRRVVDV